VTAHTPTSGGPIFISYASEDAAAADQMRAGLEQAGLPCWIAPRDIEPGTSFPAAITAAVSSCRALVLLLTDASNASPHVLSEIDLAFNARKPILAVLVGNITPSPNLQYFISTTHWFDAESSFDEEDLARLRADLEKLLAGERIRVDRERARRRTSWKVAAVAGVVAVGLGLGLYALFRPGPSPAPENPTAGPTGTGGTRPAPENPPTAAAPVAAPPGVTTPATPVAPSPATPAASSPTTSGPRTKVNAADSQTYVWIPPGRFSMGCSAGDADCQPDEMPTHAVRIRAGFWLAQTEVTVAQYRRRGRLTASQKNTPGNVPVTEVDWNEAKAYCAAIGGRLPTEAEWEYAARAGTSERYYDTLSTIAWYDDNSDERGHSVGGKSPNAFGLHDMLGNVYEWVRDRYYNKYDDTDDAIEEPLAANASGVARGGAWTSGANDVRVTNRFDLPPDAAEPNVGFRCALTGA